MGLINTMKGVVNTAKRERWLYNKAKEVSKMYIVIPNGIEYVVIVAGGEVGRFTTEKEALNYVVKESYRIAEELYRTEPRQSKPKYI